MASHFGVTIFLTHSLCRAHFKRGQQMGVSVFCWGSLFYWLPSGLPPKPRNRGALEKTAHPDVRDHDGSADMLRTLAVIRAQIEQTSQVNHSGLLPSASRQLVVDINRCCSKDDILPALCNSGLEAQAQWMHLERGHTSHETLTCNRPRPNYSAETLPKTWPRDHPPLAVQQVSPAKLPPGTACARSMAMAVPKLVVFDLDACCWYPEMYMLRRGAALRRSPVCRRCVIPVFTGFWSGRGEGVWSIRSREYPSSHENKMWTHNILQ